MFTIPLVTSSESFDVPKFWEIVLLYHNRPYLANKLVTAVTEVLFCKIETKISFNHISELFTNSAILYERRKVRVLSKQSINKDFLTSLIEPYDINVKIIESSEQNFISDSEGIYISVRLVMSRRNTDHKILEIVILDKNKDFAIFLGAYEDQEELITPKFPYEFQLSGKTFKINVKNFEDADTPQAEWLADVLFPKMLKWSRHDPESRSTLKTLSLVPIDEYSVIYNRLKKTYVEGLLKDWLDKTNTDPQKYIFEDLAIASYLICLWEKYPKEDINFVDCGCGNGLLVHILNQEGFKGYGIDIRKRTIWDVYPKDTRLEVGTVTPESTFPEATWLIGNHSDELTPWIPVMALKSSPKTNFFLLPCCSYDFDGKKYVRKNTSRSTYLDYLDYIESICKKCKFGTDLDKLRIPSTKKICLVGIHCSSEELKLTLKIMEDFVKSKMKSEFKARPAVEPVTNCTQLNRELLDKLISVCVDLLLKEKKLITKSDGEFWNKGSSLTIQEISKKLSKEDLNQLKKQGKGLQTLFSNFRYIFEVQSGSVSIRKPTTYDVTEEKYRNKPCWFLKNHPDGCCNTPETCSYFHDKF